MVRARDSIAPHYQGTAPGGWEGSPSSPGSIGNPAAQYQSANQPATILFRDWEVTVLNGIGAPVTQNNLNFLTAWSNKENTAAAYNPLASSLPYSGSTGLPGNPSIQEYGGPVAGGVATSNTLLNGNYNDIVSALRNNTANPSASYGGLNTWSGGGYSSLSGMSTQLKPLPSFTLGNPLATDTMGQLSAQLKAGNLSAQQRGSFFGSNGAFQGALFGGATAINKANPFNTTNGPFSSITKLATNLTSGSFWLKAGFVIIGLVFIFIAVSKLSDGDKSNGNITLSLPAKGEGATERLTEGAVTA